MPDKYLNFKSLLENEPPSAYQIECVDQGSSVAVIAPHAGRIEFGTSEICRAVAACGLSFYLFEGLKPQANSDLHLTSTRFDEPQGLGLAQSAQVVLTIHGQSGSECFVHVGGLHEILCRTLIDLLNQAGFSASTQADAALQGRSSSNICNRGRSGKGVQLELSRGLREELLSHAEQLSRFASVVQQAFKSV